MINAGRSKSTDGDPAGTIRASGSFLQEYSQKRGGAEIPAYRKYDARPPRISAAALQRSTQAPTPSPPDQAVQIREITPPSVLAHERYHAVQRRDRELVVSQNVVAAVLRPHADARREI